jgi:hypothetical protein
MPQGSTYGAILRGCGRRLIVAIIFVFKTAKSLSKRSCGTNPNGYSSSARSWLLTNRLLVTTSDVGFELLDSRLLRRDHPVNQIANRNQAHNPTPFHHRQVTDPPFGHDVHTFLNSL